MRHQAGKMEGNLSFSWYCRFPIGDTAGTAVRMGDAMLGLAAVASTRPAWVGTVAATLRNMVSISVCAVCSYGGECPPVVLVAGRCWYVCVSVGVAEMLDGRRAIEVMYGKA